MRRKTVSGIILLLLIGMLTLTFSIQPVARAQKDKIKIGVAHDLSGPFAPGTPYTQGRANHMWVDQVNARGGIYVEEYGKQLPLELIEYDDTGDHLQTLALYERLIEVDQVDLILPPYSTGIVLATVPLINDYGYPMIGIACCAAVLLEMQFPYFFYMLPQVWDQAPDLADILVDVGVESVSLIWVYEEHGIEMTAILRDALEARGIPIVMDESYPMDIADMTPLISQAMDLNADAFIAASYPPDSMLLTGTVMAMDYNPNIFFVGVASSYPWYRDAFGTAVVEGIMGWGAWSPEQSPELQAWTDEYIAYSSDNWTPAEVSGREPCYWATAYTWASLQVLEQAVETAGTLDRAVIRDTLETETFDTILGPVYFLDDPYHYHNAIVGTIGQWHLGEFEVLAPKDNATMTPIYPKLPWSWAQVQSDVNKDGFVDIFDIVIVAKAFGTEPGDPRWYSLADVNNDSIVDIFDVVIIAKDFGKTV